MNSKISKENILLMLRKQGKTVSTMANIERLIAMSNTIEHDYQYKGLMYVSIAESKCFNNEAIINGMRIIVLGWNSEDNKDTEYIYIQSANKSELIYHTPTKRGTIRKAFDLLYNIFNKTK